MCAQAVNTANVSRSRRTLLKSALAGAALVSIAPTRAWAALNVDVSGVKALTFDMQGTVFDFYDPVVERAHAIGRKYDMPDDWAKSLPGEWSEGAHDIIVAISAGRRPWIPNTQVYEEALTPLLVERGASDRLSGDDRDELLAEWGKMIPWPDSVTGITQLRKAYTLSTLTNASMAQMTALVKNNGLPFDEVLTGELTHAYKPNPRVYELAVDYVGYRPDQLLMVSAHKWDLRAAKEAGFKTAYVPRPLELGPGHAADLKPEGFIDIIAGDLLALASKLDLERTSRQG